METGACLFIHLEGDLIVLNAVVVLSAVVMILSAVVVIFSAEVVLFSAVVVILSAVVVVLSAAVILSTVVILSAFESLVADTVSIMVMMFLLEYPTEGLLIRSAVMAFHGYVAVIVVTVVMGFLSTLKFLATVVLCAFIVDLLAVSQVTCIITFKACVVAFERM